MREDLILVAVAIILASNLNLMIGYTGYVNFGHIVFYGLGGYVGLYLATVRGWNLVLSALLAGLVVSLCALLFGLGILRLRGAYFALATIGILEAVQSFVSNFDPWGRSTGLYVSFEAYQPLGGARHALWITYYSGHRGYGPVHDPEPGHQDLEVWSGPVRHPRGRGCRRRPGRQRHASTRRSFIAFRHSCLLWPGH